MSGIGTLAERSLHASLKAWVARPGDEIEVPLDSYIIDIKRGEQLIEIQTANFTALKRKFAKLLVNHPIYLLHPIAQTKWIVRETGTGEFVSRRKSPKKGKVWDVFSELVRIPHLLPNPNLSIGVLLTEQEEIWRDDGQGSWRRKRWSVSDRRLVRVVEEFRFGSLGDWVGLLPAGLPTPFTNKQLAQQAKIPARLAQRVTYTLRHSGAIEMVGKQGNALLFQQTKDEGRRTESSSSVIRHPSNS